MDERLMTKTMWTLDDAVKLVRALQPMSREHGYHLALAGGVLNNGSSEKDVDLCFIPLENPKWKQNADGIVEHLTKLWGKPKKIMSYAEDRSDQSDDLYEWAKKLKPRVPVQDPGFVHVPVPPPAVQINPEFAREFPPQQGAGLGQLNVEGFSQIVYKPHPKHEEYYEGKKPASVYKHRLKFIRPSGDRIDVFVL